MTNFFRDLSPLLDQPTRRRMITAAAALPFVGLPLRAAGEQQFPLKSDAGAPVVNFRIPSELDPATLPGVVWRGARSADAILYEFFDYNCGFCRRAAHEIEAIVAHDPKLRVGLVNLPILSVGSVHAAKIQQGVLKLYGPRKANDFHMRMFAKRGQSDAASALGVVGSMGLDARKVQDAANSDTVTEVVSRQARLASGLGLSMTPAFAIAGTGILGWPGAASLRAIIADVRKCDRPVCGEKG